MSRPIRWKRVMQADPSTTYVVHGGVFVVDRWRGVPRFLRQSERVRRRLRHADGLIGYSLTADFPRRTFIAITAWSDERSLRRFVGTAPHRGAAKATRANLGGGSKIVTWESYGSDLPPLRDDVKRQLETVPGLLEIDDRGSPIVDAGGPHHTA
jgi:heme-degrading monooxygenase HmoA